MAPKDWPGLKLRVPRLMALHAQRALLDWCEEACKKQGRDHLTALNSKHISRALEVMDSAPVLNKKTESRDYINGAY